MFATGNWVQKGLASKGTAIWDAGRFSSGDDSGLGWAVHAHETLMDEENADNHGRGYCADIPQTAIGSNTNIPRETPRRKPSRLKPAKKEKCETDSPQKLYAKNTKKKTRSENGHLTRQQRSVETIRNETPK